MFFSDEVFDPANDPVLKLTACAFGAWLIYLCVNKGRKDRQSPQRRKHRQAITAGSVDKMIDSRNFAVGKKVKSNPDLPFYSRHNYNRRRRPAMIS